MLRKYVPYERAIEKKKKSWLENSVWVSTMLYIYIYTYKVPEHLFLSVVSRFTRNRIQII